jgi:hypothetical protein
MSKYPPVKDAELIGSYPALEPQRRKRPWHSSSKMNISVNPSLANMYM